MLTSNYLMNVAEPMVELWSQVECDILDDVARRLVKSSGALTETAKWQIVKAREMGILQTDISKTLAKATKASEKEMYQLIVNACKESLAFDDAIYLQAGYYPLPLAQSQALMDVISAGCRKTGGLMRNFTNTTAQTATMAFENSLDRAYLQVQSGAFSYTEALKRAINDLANNGIEKIAYPSGHVDRMDVATRRALITGLNQTSAELQLARASELETEYVETSSHAGARPTHAEWQGQVFQLVGRGKYENFYDATGYGTGDGLCGWNCRHSFFPYFEGISERAYERDPAARIGKSNDQVYEESQKQRYYERQVRDSRRKCATLSAAKDAATDPQTKAALDAEFQNAAVTLKRREAALDNYCSQTGRTKVVDRTYVPSYNRSVSSKSTWAARKAAQQATGTASAAKAAASMPPAAADSSVLFSKLSGTSGSHDSYRKALSAKYDAGTDLAKTVYSKYVPAGGAVVDGSYSGTAYHQSGSVYMNYASDANNTRGAGTTFFHEHGHLVDYKNGFISAKKTGFEQALRNDFEAALTATGQTGRNAQKAYLSNVLRCSPDTIHSVSDLMHGLSNGRVSGWWSHKTSYWKNDSTKLPKEAFAHMFEASFSQEKTILMEKYFPTAFEEFKKILEGIK